MTLGLYARSQIEDSLQRLSNHVYGNPHSASPTAQRSTSLVNVTRARVLEYFGATADYDCIFTHNASGALRIIGDFYPMTSLLLCADNHNSVTGLREAAKSRRVPWRYFPVDGDGQIQADVFREMLHAGRNGLTDLVAYNALSNFDGTLHSWAWVEEAQNLGYDVLLDCAAFAPTHSIDLSKGPKPDFLVFSFYKMFGYPTGLGALLVKKTRMHELLVGKRYFAGGTIMLASVNEARGPGKRKILLSPGDGFILHQNHEGLEDGTLNFLAIPDLSAGLLLLEEKLPIMAKRLPILTEWLLVKLSELRHSNGTLPVHQRQTNDSHHRP